LKLVKTRYSNKEVLLFKIVLTLLLTLLFWFALPHSFSKYSLKESYPPKVAYQNCQFEFVDLTGDNEVELLIGMEVLEDNLPRYSILICNVKALNSQHVLEQMNFNELFSGQFKFITGDFNKDKRTDIFVPNIRSDSLFLGVYVYDTINNKFPQAPFKEVYLDSAIKDRGHYAIRINAPLLRDFDSDGWNEVIFSIENGYGIYPRKHYRYNVRKNTVKRTPFYGFTSGISDTLILGDSVLFTTSNGARGNIQDSSNISHSDYYSYIYAFNDQLKPLFPPKKGYYFPSGTYTYFGTDSTLIVFEQGKQLINGKVSKDHFNRLSKYSLDGELMLQKELMTNVKYRFQKINDIILLASSDGTVYEVEPDLSLIESDVDLSLNQWHYDYKDLDDDGYLEEVRIDRIHSKIIFSDVGRDEVYSFPMSYAKFSPMPTQIFNYDGGYHIAVLEDKDLLKFYQLLQNPYYWLVVPYLILLFLASFVIISLVLKYQERRLAEQAQIKEELSRLQLLNIKNQVDPHFTLNALNSIDAMYRAGEEEKASNYMVRFSRMIHQTLMSSEKISSSLKDELEFVAHYCKLEEYKAVNGFEYDIDVEEGIDLTKIEVPKHLVFTYVENAIKHGLRPKEKDAKLVIEVSREVNNIILKVKDNGIGYKGSKAIKTSGTKRGLSIVTKILSLYEKMNGIDIKVETEHFEPNKADHSTITSIRF
jgi:hypothetical protein